MTIAAQGGVFSYALQADKGTLGTDWYRHKVENTDFDAQEQVNAIPLEVGGDPTPTGLYKLGAFIAGGAAINPRMEGDLGWLLKAGLGKVTSYLHLDSEAGAHASHALDGTTVSTGFTDPPAPGRKLVLTVYLPSALPASPAVNLVVNGDADTPTETFNLAGLGSGTHILYGGTVFDTLQDYDLPNVSGGTVTLGWQVAATTAVYDHIFTFDPADPFNVPWLSVRKFVPGRGAVPGVVTVGMDCLLTALGFTFPNGGIIKAGLQVIGRVPTFDDNPTLTYEDMAENHKSIPLTCDESAFVKLPQFSATPMKVTGGNVQLTNSPTTPDEERIIGSPYPDDFVIRTRAAMCNLGVKWENPDLYLKMLTGSPTGTAWTNQVFESDLDIKAVSAAVIGATTHKYGLRVRANKVNFRLGAPIPLQAGGMLGMALQGTFVTPDQGSDYIQLIVTNGQASYA